MKKSVWLHNIRSVYNVGSIFRTADALGIDHIYLSGYTPHPIDRFGRKRADLHKSALGAEESVAWSFLKQIPDDILALQKNGALIISLEQDPRSLDYRQFNLPSCRECIMALGEETTGISAELRDLSDVILEIPMYGTKESLNVSVAFGIAGYQVFGNTFDV